MKQAIFLDRDGTIIEDLGHLSDPSQVVFYPDTIPALRLLQKYFRLFIVTNQPGISEGTITHEDVQTVHNYILGHLADYGIQFEQVYYCPHHRSEGCTCIKPNPYFLDEAARDYGIDLKSSFVVGDHPHDVTFAENAGAAGIYLLTGHGEKHRCDLKADCVVTSGIWRAALRILEMSGHAGDAVHLIDKAAELLKKGGVVAFPTETVYGLGANAFDAKAVARIFEIKNRPRFDPLVVHVADFEQAERVVADFPEMAKELCSRFWPGPLTLVLPKSDDLPEIVTSGLRTVAVRMPDHPVALSLIREAGVPVAAPSANPFGRISPTTADHVREQLGDHVDMILDGGPCRVGVESTILSLIDEQPTLLRPGGLPVEQLESIVGKIAVGQTPAGAPLAPGQLDSHYAPHTPVIISPHSTPPTDGKRAGLICLRKPDITQGFEAVEELSTSGNMQEAAANLFAAMHRLDALHLDIIFAQPVPNEGLGLAINDRLRRAAHRKD